MQCLINVSGIDDEIRKGFLAECASPASFHENRIIYKETHQLALQLMLKTHFKGFINLRTFGEMCAVTEKKNIKGLFSDIGALGLFVGYPQYHADDIFRIFSLKTKQIIKSRDLI